MTARVTVLLGVHNAQPSLPFTLNSLRDQTYRDWECLLIDDGSSDESAAELARFARLDDRFRVVRHSENKGLTLSLIEGLASSTGDYIARHDTDDFSRSDRFDLQVRALDLDPHIGVVASDFLVIDTDGTPLSVSHPPRSQQAVRAELRRRNPFAHGSLMFRRSALESVGGYRAAFRMAQDYDLLLRLMEKWTLETLPEPLYRLRLNAGGGSLNRLPLQTFYADLARACATARRNGHPDATLLENLSPPAPLGSSAALAEQRYHCLRALHLIKSGRTNEARASLAQCTDPEFQKSVFSLRWLSYAPGFLLRRLFRQ